MSVLYSPSMRWAGVCALVLSTACTHYGDDSSRSLTLPPRNGFEPVSAVLEAHCGTLDCHGGPARNLRIYGVYGLRASGNSVTGRPDTTEEDIDATYESLVSVDPESLSAVHADEGKLPTRWFVVRKARGTEHHTGGVRLPAGSPGDRCLVSWIAGTVDDAACAGDAFGPEPRAGELW